MNRIIAINKPKGPTSNDVIQVLKGKVGSNKIGHAGTLDPLASGVLVVGIGREATKVLGKITKGDKEYIAKIKLGETSTTDDAEGEKTTIYKNSVGPEKDEIKKIVKEFIGDIKQVPPIYSAVKVKGKEAYKYARKGEEIELQPRKAEIDSIEILNYQWPYLDLKVATGPGVYIRSLARDIGKKLGTGAYLAELERTRVGEYTKDKSISIEKASKLLEDLQKEYL
ncbi:MAG: tRNA pseudouridine(55) synthase TruB [Candidatus Yanofskybacteria bacterium CG10_big_fil_rev_8_21_14_0_10_36_16]|uniref:tRNA pseudouridine synthase B n=1 Tax=Candidatus Yanofskybacteria bacterium CG10_big_fil_rev_8_21_14_0_10_36_16 TaxID=1975096 RepID=A0A2J0Q6L4_9BACT|nr:MAG: tRNA pseudouridine(55) synthase TruB [Candidatus Yanofskybacteria bacterium CG10_big_fil_rev_8_21_14_0_10_36_16]